MPRSAAFAERHRAEMPGHFQLARVRRADRGAELRARDVRVRFERREAKIGPVVHHLRGFFGTLERVQLQQVRAGSLEIWAGQMHLRTGNAAGVDVALHLEIRVRLHAAGRAHARDARRQIQAREAVDHRRVVLGCAGDAALACRSRVEEMLVHRDPAGHHRSPREIEHARAGRRGDRAARPDRLDRGAFDDDRLVVGRGRARAVDHADVLQRDDRSIDRDEFLRDLRERAPHRWRRWLSGCSRRLLAERGQPCGQCRDDCRHHCPHRLDLAAIRIRVWARCAASRRRLRRSAGRAVRLDPAVLRGSAASVRRAVTRDAVLRCWR